jgi:hypothetical protein
MSVRLTGRKLKDLDVHTELSSIVDQVNHHLVNITNSIPQRKYGIIPVGVVDGTNKVFTLTDKFNINSLVVWLGPTKQVKADYSVKNSTITFVTAPTAVIVECDYDPINK